MIRYTLRMLQLKKARAKILFDGPCSSACTIFLALPRRKTCVTRTASFRFHRAYGATPRGNNLATDTLMRNYPDWVRRWISANGGLTGNLKTMDYAYASKYMRPCPAKRPAASSSGLTGWSIMLGHNQLLSPQKAISVRLMPIALKFDRQGFNS